MEIQLNGTTNPFQHSKICYVTSMQELIYFAVIFTSTRKKNSPGYEEMADQMVHLASKQTGFLGIESVRDEHGNGITVSYWKTLNDISNWKKHVEHIEAQKKGRSDWYNNYHVRICKVEREYQSNVRLSD